MVAARIASVLVLAVLAGFTLTARAQDPGTFKDPYSLRESNPRSYLGLNLGRSHYENTNTCSGTALVCDPGNATTRLYAGASFGRNWGAEFGYIDLGRVLRPTGESRAQGLNLSVVGRTRLANSWGVFGRVGTTYGRTDTTALAASTTGIEQGFGLSVGGGVSYEFTPRLSGTLELEAHDLRFAGGARDPVRSTNLGLQYRY
jgi:OmpA-OmpF porin, OOP family